MRIRLRLLAVGLCSVTTVLAGMTIVPLLTTADAHAPSGTTVRVASFNISSVAFDKKASGDHEKWKARRPVIVDQILSRRLDVVGLQEADQSSIYHSSVTYGANQYMDLVGALNARGGHWAVTNRAAYDCRRSFSSQHCHKVNRAASQDTRVIYNKATVRMVRRGALHFRHQSAGHNQRYLSWAVFRARSTGKKFLFADTHLDPSSKRVRKAEWREVIRKVDRLKGSKPVVVVGDFNTSKFDSYARTFLPAMRNAGYGDVLNQTYASPVVQHPRAESTDNAWINSFNAFRRNVRLYSYEDAKFKVGNGVDWIFATNSVKVRNWEVVADLDSSYNLRGVIPSDHAMVTSTLTM
jgi:endonuclease/exonuclease/phosphatase family metal-dependent hydrolase